MIAAAGLVLTLAAVPLPHTRSGHGPAVVLVHGLGGDRHVWDDAALKLAKTHTVIALDLPGHGAAPAPERFDADAIAARIAATVRAEKAMPAVLVGHSLGGYVAAHVPLVDPEVARALVLVDTGIGRFWPDAEIAEMSAALAKDREATLRSWFGALTKNKAQLERVLPGLRKLPNATLVGYMHVMQQATPGKRLTLPVLLMATRLLLPDKKPRVVELAEAGFGDVPKLEAVRFDDSMHWLFWDEPAKFMTTLSELVARVER